MNIIRFGRSVLALVTAPGQPVSLRSKLPKPVLLTPPAISGSASPAVVGTVFTRTAGTYKGATSVTWQWKAGPTVRQTGGATYTAVAGDVGLSITAVDTATNFAGSTVIPSNGVPVT